MTTLYTIIVAMFVVGIVVDWAVAKAGGGRGR